MADLTGWLCWICTESYDENKRPIVHVNWDDGSECGVSYVEPPDLKGSHITIIRDNLMPIKRDKDIRAATHFEDMSENELLTQLDALQTRRTAKTSRDKKPSLSAEIKKLTPEQLVKFKELMAQKLKEKVKPLD